MSQNRGQNGGDFGAILPGLCLLGEQKDIVGCNVMIIHNEALLLITSGLWVKALQHYSSKNTYQKVKNILYIYINIEVFCGIIIAD